MTYVLSQSIVHFFVSKQFLQAFAMKCSVSRATNKFVEEKRKEKTNKQKKTSLRDHFEYKAVLYK